MTEVWQKEKAKEIIVEVVVTRADGSTENKGIVSYWHRNPFKRIIFKLKHPHVGKARLG